MSQYPSNRYPQHNSGYNYSYGPNTGYPVSSSNYSSTGYLSTAYQSSNSRYHPYEDSSNPYSYNNNNNNNNSSSNHKYNSSNNNNSSNSYRKSKAYKNEFGISYGQPGSNLRKIYWDKLNLPTFQKNFYRESPSVSKRSTPEVEDWRKQKSIHVVGERIPKPVLTFEEAGFPEYIQVEIRKAGFKEPTSIQAQGWPMSMSGRDVIGIAQTGSGKTLAFILPSIVHINAQPLLREGDGPIVLVIAPTRELAIQIDKETSKFAYSSKIKHTCVYGGVSKREQAKKLKEGIEICICTPGRLLDFLESGTTNLRRVTYLVIDEADRLLDMGFEPQLKAILSQVRPDRQILMWSATWPKEVRALANSFTKEGTLQVSVGSWDTTANKNVKQIIEIISPYEKQNKLYKLLREQWTNNTSNGITPKILVFVATKRMCNELVRSLQRDEWPATCIHGDKQQFERDRALEDFKSGKCPILLATDVASRGIHVDNVTHVINYDFPGNIEDYVHRIGRTGRCNKKGTAISLFTREDSKRATKLIEILTKAKQNVPNELRKLQIESQIQQKWKSQQKRNNAKHNSNNNNNSSSNNNNSYYQQRYNSSYR